MVKPSLSRIITSNRGVSMFRMLLLFTLLIVTTLAQKAPEVPAMPKALMKLPRTNITRAKFPTVDFHFHGRSLRTPQDYQKLIQMMDQINLAVISNMDGGFGQAFDQAMTTGAPYKDRILPFARLNYEGINEQGWSEKTAAELERCFKAGAHGLKIWKDVGLDFKNPD